MERTISHAYESHVQEAEKVPLLPCPPMMYSDAMSPVLQVYLLKKKTLIIRKPRKSAINKNMYFSRTFLSDSRLLKSSVATNQHTVIICQHVTPIHIDAATSTTNARL